MATPDGRRVRKKKLLLKAPTLAELEAASEEEEQQDEVDAGADAGTLAYLGGISPLLRDAGPRDRRSLHLSFMPVSSTPQPERRAPGPRRHSIEKETPTAATGAGAGREFPRPARQDSRSLDEFSFPVENLALTVEEVMHIRQVLVKAELEKYQQYKEIYTALKKGKMCFCCRSKRFSLFTWAYTCHFCKRPVCSQCCKKMRFPTKHIGHIPIYSLGAAGLSAASSPTAAPAPGPALTRSAPNPRRTVSMRERASPSVIPGSGGGGGGSWEPSLPTRSTADWGCVDVCGDCRRFVADIIRSSRNPFHGDRRPPWLRRLKAVDPGAGARKFAGGGGGRGGRGDDEDGLAAATNADGCPAGMNRAFRLAVPRETPIKEV